LVYLLAFIISRPSAYFIRQDTAGKLGRLDEQLTATLRESRPSADDVLIVLHKLREVGAGMVAVDLADQWLELARTNKQLLTETIGILIRTSCEVGERATLQLATKHLTLKALQPLGDDQVFLLCQELAQRRQVPAALLLGWHLFARSKREPLKPKFAPQDMTFVFQHKKLSILVPGSVLEAFLKNQQQLTVNMDVANDFIAELKACLEASPHGHLISWSDSPRSKVSSQNLCLIYTFLLILLFLCLDIASTPAEEKWFRDSTAV